MSVETISPTASALKARTLHEFVSYMKHLTGDTFGFPRHIANDIQYFSPRQIWWMADRAARRYMVAGLSSTERKTVGLRNLSTIETVISFLAIVRLGHTVLFLSPHLKPSIIGHLLEKAAASIVIDGTDDLDELARLGHTVLPLETVESLGGILSDTPDESSADCLMDPELWSQISDSETAILLHSSGSTGTPKLIPKTHLAVMTRLRSIPSFCHDKSFFMGSWLYFSVGVFGMLFALMKPGGPTCWANERLRRLDANVYRDVLVATRPQLARCHPNDLIRCMSTAEGLAVLKRCIMVTVTGEVMPESLGNRLVQEGVHLSSEYSMSELSFTLSSGVRRHGDPEWEYMSANAESAPHLWFRPRDPSEGAASEEDGRQLYELVVLPSHPTLDKERVNSPDGAFYTGDVFVKHPTKESYKCIGRMSDDVSMVPQNDRIGLRSLAYEHKALDGNRDVLQEAVLFGNERPRAGVLLFTQPGCVVSSEEVLERVWATVQRGINHVLPVALDKDMLVVVRDAIVPRTAKGNFVRHEVYRKYEREINQAYGVA
jgi:acyl-coenzyme A synthetase/AMP-(fatty) acid ligase